MEKSNDVSDFLFDELRSVSATTTATWIERAKKHHIATKNIGIMPF